MFLVYEALLMLALIIGLPYFLVRGKYAANFRERLGFYRTPAAAHDLWIHAVSVGETVAARAASRWCWPTGASPTDRFPDTTPCGRSCGASWPAIRESWRAKERTANASSPLARRRSAWKRPAT